MANSEDTRDLDWWNTARRWMASLQQRHSECGDAIRELREAGCQDTELAALLMAVHDAKKRVDANRVSPSDLRALAEDMKKWALKIRALHRSSYAPALIQEEPMEGPLGTVVSSSVNIPERLEHLAKEVTRIAPHATKLEHLAVGRALMRLEDYVRRVTGESGRRTKPHHNALDVIARAILGQPGVSVRHYAMRYRRHFADMPRKSAQSGGSPAAIERKRSITRQRRSLP